MNDIWLHRYTHQKVRTKSLEFLTRDSSKESRNWRLYRIKRRSSHRYYFSRSLQYPNLSESIVLLFDYSRISEIVHPLSQIVGHDTNATRNFFA